MIVIWQGIVYCIVYCDLCNMAGNCLYGFVYYDLCILDKFMSVMHIVQSGLCIVFAHNGAICAHNHQFPVHVKLVSVKYLVTLVQYFPD